MQLNPFNVWSNINFHFLFTFEKVFLQNKQQIYIYIAFFQRSIVYISVDVRLHCYKTSCYAIQNKYKVISSFVDVLNFIPNSLLSRRQKEWIEMKRVFCLLICSMHSLKQKFIGRVTFFLSYCYCLLLSSHVRFNVKFKIFIPNEEMLS